MVLPTAIQRSIASGHGVPLDQAHTINVKKYWEYLKWKCLPCQKIDRILDEIERSRFEWLRGR